MSASLIGAGLSILSPGIAAGAAADPSPLECLPAALGDAVCLPETEAPVQPPIGVPEVAADESSVGAARRRPHKPSSAPPVAVADPETVTTDDPRPLVEVTPTEAPPPEPPPAEPPPPEEPETAPLDPPAEASVPAAPKTKPAAADPPPRARPTAGRLPSTGAPSALFAAAGALLSLGGFCLGAGATAGRRTGRSRT